MNAVPADLVEVARIVDAYGIRGWVKLDAYSTDAGALHAASKWWVRSKDGMLRCLTRVESKAHSGTVVAQLEEVLDRTGAEALKGATVSVPRSMFPDAGGD